MAALDAAVVAGLEPILPQIASSAYGIRPAAIGRLFAGAPLASVLVYPLAGGAADRFPARRVAAFGTLLAALSFACLALAGSSLGLGLVGAAIGSAFILAPTIGLIAKAAESRHPPLYGGAYSLYNKAYSVGLAVGPLTSSAIFALAGLE
jgi:MFS transporter, DHA1 family, solute carrier family 18 (vesicular amine transporter), member 1/2